MKEKKNNELLNSRLVYARSCWSATSLGKACSNGCFIGYNVPFKFFINEDWSAKPLNDNTAKMFLEPSNMVVSSLLKSNTTKESVEKSVNMSKKNMMKLLNEQKEPGAMASIMLLWNNMQGLTVIGNENMKFE